MQKFATNTYKILTAGGKNRKIDFQCLQIKYCSGDSALITQVWTNLISNAVKFTGKTDKALIQISSEEKESEIIYCISDNGVGFDMKYADKLFVVFQRLHRIEEFEGTGVGLAIVKRIINRHGGRIWAEAEVNVGAKFFFTIP